MVRLTRRGFARGLGAAGLGLLGLPVIARAQGSARIVIVGGGAGGATVAALLKHGAPELDVTLIETRAAYTTCFQSNLYLGGFKSFGSLVQSYDGLRALGVRVVTEAATDVDTAAKTVKLGHGKLVAYDRLVLSPGVTLKLDAIEGYSAGAAELMPHAWNAGPQTQLLKRQLAGMRNGGTVVMAVPALPYRCPPAPYERACMIAHYLKTHKPNSKIVILDAKRSYIKQALFEDAFSTLYKGMIEVALTDEIDDNTVVRVDAGTGEVETKSGRKIIADVANIIPPQRAGDIAAKAGCTTGEWCQVKLDSFKSDSVADVYVLGDSASAPEMPKSAYSANSQAKVVAADILADVAGKERDPARFANSCWSMLGPGESVKIGAHYKPGLKDGKPALVASGMFISASGESAAVRKRTHDEAAAWYEAITNEAFPKAVAAPEPEAGEPRPRRRRLRG